jgi:predicted RNA-binding Zn-ribbon protein involved in translation (DUF1610 family)
MTVGTRRSVIPSAGYVNFVRAPKSLVGREKYAVNLKKRIYVSQKRLRLLNGYQQLANKLGFVVALVCPNEGEIVKTRRMADLDDAVLAECPRCGKQWLEKEDD